MKDTMVSQGVICQDIKDACVKNSAATESINIKEADKTVSKNENPPANKGKKKKNPKASGNSTSASHKNSETSSAGNKLHQPSSHVEKPKPAPEEMIQTNTDPSAPTIEDLSSDEEDDGNINPWVTVQNKKLQAPKPVSYAAAAVSGNKNNATRSRKFIVGKSSESSELRSSKKQAQLFTSHWGLDTTPVKILGWLKSQLDIEYQCDEVPTKASYYKCFKVTALCDDPEFFYSPDIWPAGVFVRKFYVQRENKGPRKVGHIPEMNTIPGSSSQLTNNSPTNALIVGNTEQSGSGNV